MCNKGAMCADRLHRAAATWLNKPHIDTKSTLGCCQQAVVSSTHKTVSSLHTKVSSSHTTVSSSHTTGLFYVNASDWPFTSKAQVCVSSGDIGVNQGLIIDHADAAGGSR